MSKKDRAPHVTRGDSRRLLAIIQSRVDNPKGRIKQTDKPKSTKGAK